MRVVFFGTPEFAVPSLAALVRRHDVALVLTQPDRPKGRGRQVGASPVKTLAGDLGLPLLQPARLDEEPLRAHLAAAEAAVVVAYGLKIPDWLLARYPRGAINVHGSLLPAYRGAAPVSRAIINGDAETGVTTMLLGPRMDAGPILLQRHTPVDPEETAGELAARLAALGAELLVETLDGLAAGTVEPHEQDEARASYAPKLRKEDGLVDWSRSARAIVNLVRGVNPWPGAHTHFGGTPLKILKAAAAPRAALGAPPVAPGTVLAASPPEGLLVACGDGAVALLTVQTEGRRPLSVPDYLRGSALGPGVVLR